MSGQVAKRRMLLNHRLALRCSVWLGQVRAISSLGMTIWPLVEMAEIIGVRLAYLADCPSPVPAAHPSAVHLFSAPSFPSRSLPVSPFLPR